MLACILSWMAQVPAPEHGATPAFVENRGQEAREVLFTSAGGGARAFFTREGMLLAFTVGSESAPTSGDSCCASGRRTRKTGRSILGLTLEGAAEDLRVEGREPLPGRYSFFRGRDAERWVTGAAAFARLCYRDVLPGVDLELYWSGGALEYDLVVGPGASSERLVLRLDGAQHLELEADGSLCAETPLGRLRQSPPRVRVLRDGGDMLPGNDVGIDVAVDSAGVVTLIGHTGSEDFPTTAGSYDPIYNGGVELNELGDTFLVRLDPSLSGAAQLVYSTYLGGSLIDNGFALALQPDGNATIAGHCHSPEFPTTSGSFQPVINAPGPGDAFVCRLALAGNGAADLLWSTFLGGSGFDYGYGLGLDAAGRAIVAGQAGTTADFPVTAGAFDETHNGANEGFVAILDPALSGAAQLVYSTYLGGSRIDTLYELDLLPAGDVVVAGHTASTDLPVKPVPGALDGSFNGGAMDVFAARLSLDAAGAADLVWCTYLGGGGEERTLSMAARLSGALTLAGFTGSSDFPVTIGAAQPSFGGGTSDAFLARIDPAGGRLLSSTYLGGDGYDQGFGVALDGLGNAIVVGATTSPDFPATAGVLAPAFNGGPFDAFVARLCPEPCALPASFECDGSGTGGVAGVPELRAIGEPVLGNADFAIELSRAAPLASGSWIVISLPGSPPGTLAGSGAGRVPPLRIALTTDGQGKAVLPWPVPCLERSCGTSLVLRAVVQDAAAPNGRAISGRCVVRFGS